MKIAVFSDLHLRRAHDRQAQIFASMLASLHKQGINQLWLLGDIYDLFIGNYSFWRQEHAAVFEALEALTKSGCKVLWCEGNHDFHITKVLASIGVEVFDGERSFELGSHKIYLAHGDLVHLDDKPYQRWRAFTRDARFRKALDLAPEFLASRLLKPLAESVSRKSRRHSREQPAEIQARYRLFAEERWREGFDAVFLGHCHVKDLYIQNQKFYCNLGSGLNGQISYALWEPNGNSSPEIIVQEVR